MMSVSNDSRLGEEEAKSRAKGPGQFGLRISPADAAHMTKRDDAADRQTETVTSKTRMPESQLKAANSLPTFPAKFLITDKLSASKMPKNSLRKTTRTKNYLLSTHASSFKPNQTATGGPLRSPQNVNRDQTASFAGASSSHNRRGNTSHTDLMEHINMSSTKTTRFETKITPFQSKKQNRTVGPNASSPSINTESNKLLVRPETKSKELRPAHDVSFRLDGIMELLPPSSKRYYEDIFKHMHEVNEEVKKEKESNPKPQTLPIEKPVSDRLYDRVFEIKTDSGTDLVEVMAERKNIMRIPPELSIDLRKKKTKINQQRHPFLESLLSYPNLIPKDDSLTKHLTDSVAGSLSSAPAGRKEVENLRLWLDEKMAATKDINKKNEIIQLAMIEAIRQVHVTCFERGEILLFGLSHFKQTNDTIIMAKESAICLKEKVINEEKAKLQQSMDNSLQSKIKDILLKEDIITELRAEIEKQHEKIEEMKVMQVK